MATETAVDVVMPQMGVSVSEGTITKWLKSVGEEISADEPLLEISTDKVDTEVPSPATGTLQEILSQEGETVAVGTKIAVISPEGAPAAEAADVPEPATAQAAAESEDASGAEGETATAEPAQEAEPGPAETAEARPSPQPPPAGDGRGDKAFVSPVVGRIAAEHSVDVTQVEGTGRGGRVTKKDILAFIDSGGAKETPAPAQEPAPPEAPAKPAERAPEPATVQAATPAAPQAGETVEPMTPMRKGIAEHMRRSLDTAAHVTTTFEVDMARVVAAREKLKREFQEKHGVKLTYLPLIARATIDTIGDWPWMNAEVRGDSIVVKQYVNLGIAVALEGGKGLIVPVIKSTEGLNLLGLTRAIIAIADRARSKKLLPDDVQGGTFTITNPGGFGAIHGTPIISQPQVAILDVEALVKRPVVVTDDDGNDSIAIRPMMNLCLSYDHRLVDGAYAAQFMRDLRERLQTWDESAY
ncbi:MAG: 2-oxoglutarate dehydrogenase, E2 component, dihydrolipoamide succinyltransferase [Actinobacteria bacterium]|nr:2-oxoglutarate dehydrogenase, E2 component, dihydrolipoamide succinyltransferase [Actinomycetota bacterium]